jgi:hypothetical protein
MFPCEIVQEEVYCASASQLVYSLRREGEREGGRVEGREGQLKFINLVQWIYHT